MITLVFSETQAKKLGGCYEVMVDDVPTKFTTCYFTAADGRKASADDENRMSSSLSSVDRSIWPGGLEEIRKTF